MALKAISLFTGIGGLDFGFEAAGFNTRVAVELDAACCHTIRMNRTWAVIERDIHAVTSKKILKAGKLRVGEADVLTGGPPCQLFSKSGYWARGDARRLDDPRADTLTAYLRVLRDTQPKAFLLENVYGLAYKGKDEGLDRILLVSMRLIAKRVPNICRFGGCWMRQASACRNVASGCSFWRTATARSLSFRHRRMATSWTYSEAASWSRIERRGMRLAICRKIRTSPD